MIKHFCTLILLLSLNISNAQLPGSTLIDETSEWNFRGSFSTWDILDCQGAKIIRSSYTYYIQKDTLIDGQTYLKMNENRIDSVYCLNDQTNYTVDTMVNLKEYIREEDNKLFIYDIATSSEELFYDYNNISLGSALSTDCTVGSVDTLYLLDQPFLKYNCFCNSEFLIQGIGTKRHLFASLECGAGIEGDFTNICYTKNGYTVTVDSLAECVSNLDSTIQVSVNESITETSKLIYPNPTTGIINIEVAEKLIESYSIYATDGKRLFHSKDINANQISIDISNIIEGIYVIVLKLDSGNIIREKVVKTKN